MIMGPFNSVLQNVTRPSATIGLSHGTLIVVRVRSGSERSECELQDSHTQQYIKYHYQFDFLYRYIIYIGHAVHGTIHQRLQNTQILSSRALSSCVWRQQVAGLLVPCGWPGLAVCVRWLGCDGGKH